MKTELTQDYFNEFFDAEIEVGCIVENKDNNHLEITKFTGYRETNEGVEGDDEITVHFSDGSALELDTFNRAIFTKTLNPISPDWFVESIYGTPQEQAARTENKTEQKKAIEKHSAQWKDTKKLTCLINRPIDALSDTEIFAKVLGSSLSIAENVLNTYDGNLKQMAGSSAKEMKYISGIGDSRSQRLAAALELGKRLARSHAEKSKITSPADVADLMMPKMRYLQKEIVTVIALDTKGGVTTTGKIGKSARKVKWGKMLSESTIFEGTLNASVFHPREIFRFAIKESANSIILVHNHPSGDPQPSQEDIHATKQCIEAGNQIGIKVLDHIIIGDGIFVSLKDEKLI